jgi:hypothetical protein
MRPSPAFCNSQLENDLLFQSLVPSVNPTLAQPENRSRSTQRPRRNEMRRGAHRGRLVRERDVSGGRNSAIDEEYWRIEYVEL